MLSNQKLKILLAKDDEISRAMATEILRSFGIDVDHACNGAEAIEMFEQADYEIVLINTL